MNATLFARNSDAAGYPDDRSNKMVAPLAGASL
jgi:hypothetical protein